MKAETFIVSDTEHMSSVITISEDDVIEKCPWLNKVQAREVITNLTAYFQVCTNAFNEAISDTVTNLGHDRCKYILETRLGKHDTWTSVALVSEKELDEEILHRLKRGWEVWLPEYTQKLCNNELS